MQVKNNRGVILLLTLLILSSILVVTLGAADLVLAGIKMNRQTGYSNIAFFASEAGLERALWQGRKSGVSLPPDSTPDLFLDALPNGSTYKVDYTLVPGNGSGDDSIVFKSIGSYAGVKRSVEGTYEVE